MGFLDERRRLFALYIGLIVVPSLILAMLYARSLEREYERDLASLPLEARDAASRLEDSIRTRLGQLFAAENLRPFKQFAVDQAVGSTPGILTTERSPLYTMRPPEGVQAWLALETTREGVGSIELFEGPKGLSPRESEALYLATGDFLRSYLAGDPLDRIGDFLEPREELVPALTLGVLLLGDNELDRRCLEQFAHMLADSWYPVTITGFRPRFFRDASGVPRLLATRRVMISSPVDGEVTLPEGAPCVKDLASEFSLIQGFYLDVEWLTRELPRSLAATLGATDSLREFGPNTDPRAAVVRPLDLFAVEAGPGARDFGALAVGVDASTIRSRYVRSRRRLFGLGLMLLAAVLSGIFLLYRRVQNEIDQAQRTEDFVASVTHELRTPLSTIRLHGEMLAEGWTDDPEVKRSYYERILNETERLSQMVERILQTSRVKKRAGGDPIPGDLNALLERLRAQLERPSHDLSFVLEPELPLVWMTADEITSIVANLVENARKYAPVKAGAEPIQLRTRSERGAVVLEVLDRGPGVPPAERERIFEAFYRMGREHRRETQGTGLGLHLVRLAAQRLGGSVRYRAREGGGSAFQVVLRVAKPTT